MLLPRDHHLPGSQGGGSVSQVLAYQAGGPNLDLLNPCKMADVAAFADNLSAEDAETRGSLGIPDQQSLTDELQVKHKSCLTRGGLYS